MSLLASLGQVEEPYLDKITSAKFTRKPVTLTYAKTSVTITPKLAEAIMYAVDQMGPDMRERMERQFRRPGSCQRAIDFVKLHYPDWGTK